MKKFTARVVSVHSGSNKDSTKDEQPSIQLELEGIVGDAHKSYERSCWAGGDKQPEGTVRRNERQWSAVSAEELQQSLKYHTTADWDYTIVDDGGRPESDIPPKLKKWLLRVRGY